MISTPMPVEEIYGDRGQYASRKVKLEFQETRYSNGTGVRQESPFRLVPLTSVLIHFTILALSHSHFLLLSAATHGYVTKFIMDGTTRIAPSA